MQHNTLLVIDDEPQIRKLLQINLESNDYKVILASTGKEGLLLAANHFPDLILLDIGLPDINGHTLLKQLKEWYSKPIIILSVNNDEQGIISALDNGANDYLTKPFRTGELLARIRAAIKNSQSIDAAPSVCFDDLEIDFIGRVLKKNGQIIKLTTTEFNLMALFAKNEGKVLTHNYILKEIWGVGYQNETQYLRVFVGSLRKKIESEPHHSIHIITESGIGYRFQ
jgi:two-component system KDP operon response regulator KdpE